MKIDHTIQNVEKYKGDMVTYFVHQHDKKAPQCSNEYVQHAVEIAFRTGDFTGREGETLLFYPSDKGDIQAKRILVVGLGKAEEGRMINGVKPADGWRENYRKAGGQVSGTALKTSPSPIPKARMASGCR